MENGKTHHHHNNLLHLNLPDEDTLLGLFNNHPFQFPLINTNTNTSPTPSPPFSAFNHQHSPFTGYAFQDSPEISPSCSTAPPEPFGGAVDRLPHHPIKPNGVMGGKRRKMVMNNKKGMEKLPREREVIHVRAKRGQATDSHSLAERVRRERINDKLKVLQDLVPGCYKTMGMAVMLDVIINYVQSLQNQIEFLSMKLSAASMFYDFNSPEAEAMEAFQRTNPCEAREMERMMMSDEGFDQGLASSNPAHADDDHSLHSTWPF